MKLSRHVGDKGTPVRLTDPCAEWSNRTQRHNFRAQSLLLATVGRYLTFLRVALAKSCEDWPVCAATILKVAEPTPVAFSCANSRCCQRTPCIAKVELLSPASVSQLLRETEHFCRWLRLGHNTALPKSANFKVNHEPFSPSRNRNPVSNRGSNRRNS